MLRIKILHCLLIIAFLAINGFSQSDTKEEISGIYKKFADAYSKLDADAAANLYASDALIIYLYDDSQPSSIAGRENIKKSFTDFFQNFSQNKSRLNITFKIADRKSAADEIFDSGFYQLEIISAENKKSYSFGKFSAVLTRSDNDWEI